MVVAGLWGRVEVVIDRERIPNKDGFGLQQVASDSDRGWAVLATPSLSPFPSLVVPFHPRPQKGHFFMSSSRGEEQTNLGLSGRNWQTKQKNSFPLFAIFSAPCPHRLPAPSSPPVFIFFIASVPSNFSRFSPPAPGSSTSNSPFKRSHPSSRTSSSLFFIPYFIWMEDQAEFLKCLERKKKKLSPRSPFFSLSPFPLFIFFQSSTP